MMLTVVSDTFLQPDPHSSTKLLPSLRYLSIIYFDVQNGDWSPLLISGGQTTSLTLCGYRRPPNDVVWEIENLVEELNIG